MLGGQREAYEQSSAPGEEEVESDEDHHELSRHGGGLFVSDLFDDRLDRRKKSAVRAQRSRPACSGNVSIYATNAIIKVYRETK